jgi:arginase
MIAHNMISLLGIPLDKNSSFLAGAALAPPKIREAFNSDSSNYYSESGIDMKNSNEWSDLGDLKLDTGDTHEIIKEKVVSVLKNSDKILSLGGDHSITYPIVKGVWSRYEKLTILHLDAHTDLYDNFENNPHSHASPFARILEERGDTRVIQVGIRTSTDHTRKQSDRFGVEVIYMHEWKDHHRFDITGPVYLSLDLDALDPAFVPGVSHYEPGGFSTRQVISIIQNLKCNVVGADLVEYNPNRDINGMTGMVAAKLMKEMLDQMIRIK